MKLIYFCFVRNLSVRVWVQWEALHVGRLSQQVRYWLFESVSFGRNRALVFDQYQGLLRNVD